MKLDKFPDIEVWIEVDGQPLREYEPSEEPDKDSQTATCYVEAQPGAEYCIKWRCKPEVVHGDEKLQTSVHVDGEYIDNLIHNRPLLSNGAQAMLGKMIRTNGQGACRHFTFTHLVTNDRSTASAKSVIKKLANLGEISVRMVKCTTTQCPSTDSTDIARAPPEIPEKALKGRAISTCSTLSRPRPSKAPDFVTCSYPYGNQPFVIYKFKYRSHHDLQIEGIIPRTPTPIPLEERDPKDLTTEEAQEVIRRLQAREAERVRIKVEGEKRQCSQNVRDSSVHDDTHDDIEVLDSSAAKRRRTGGSAPPELIDLTDD